MILLIPDGISTSVTELLIKGVTSKEPRQSGRSSVLRMQKQWGTWVRVISIKQKFPNLFGLMPPFQKRKKTNY